MFPQTFVLPVCTVLSVQFTRSNCSIVSWPVLCSDICCKKLSPPLFSAFLSRSPAPHTPHPLKTLLSDQCTVGKCTALQHYCTVLCFVKCRTKNAVHFCVMYILGWSSVDVALSLAMHWHCKIVKPTRVTERKSRY